MSLLDDLKKKAEVIKIKEIEGEEITITTVGEELRQKNASILNEKLAFIHKYLKQLADNLNIIKPENEITYNLMDPSQGHYNIYHVRKTNFSVHDGKSENGNRVLLKYDLYAKEGLSVKIRNDGKVPAIRHHLTEKTVHYFENDAEGDRIIITLAPPVSARLIYAADLDNCMIVLKLDNYDGPWANLSVYSPEAITEELMDETAKYLLGEDNRFKELSGQELRV
jgi:hypothetical protein